MTSVSQHIHKTKPEIRPASFVTMVVGSIYCNKIVLTMMKLIQQHDKHVSMHSPMKVLDPIEHSFNE